MTDERLAEIRRETCWHRMPDALQDLLVAYDQKFQQSKQIGKFIDLEAEVACATDRLNTWARESQVPECKDYFEPLALRSVVDELWCRASSTIATLREQLAAAEAEIERLRREETA